MCYFKHKQAADNLYFLEWVIYYNNIKFPKIIKKKSLYNDQCFRAVVLKFLKSEYNICAQYVNNCLNENYYGCTKIALTSFSNFF